jgi:hypothetical protein
MEPVTRLDRLQTASKLWENARAKSMTLKDALQVCHEAHGLTPFAFNNGNTFAAIAQTVVEEVSKLLPPVEAQMLRTTVGHFAVGRVSRHELKTVLKHLGPLLSRVPEAKTLQPAQPAANASTSAPARVPLAVASQHRS